MKKLLSMLLVLTMAIAMLTLVACKPVDDPEDDTDPKGEGVMTHAEYVAAEEGTVVTIEAYVQAKQGWYNDAIKVYLQDRDGGYIAYDLPCSEAEAAKLTVGTKIRVTGTKAIYKGLHEIYDAAATFEIIPGKTYVATAFDATSILDNEEELIKHQMELASFTGLTVVSVAYNNATSAADANDDIYVKVKLADGEEHSFCVEVYLTGTSTEVYQTALTLKAGDVIDVEGFLYWWNNLNTHITAITVK